MSTDPLAEGHSHPYSSCKACERATAIIKAVAEVEESWPPDKPLIGPAIEVKSTEWPTVWDRLQEAEDRIEVLELDIREMALRAQVAELTARIEKLERAL